MTKLRRALNIVVEALVSNEALLRRAQRRHRKFRQRAYTGNRKGKQAETRAGKLRARKHPKAAASEDAKAARCHARAYRSHLKAQWWIGRIKLLQARIHKLEIREEDIKEELRKLEKRDIKINVKENEVRGGVPRERLRAAALLSASRCASNKRPNYYSQPGVFTTNKCFTGENSGVDRSDCSQWVASVYAACGLEIPGTWTGDMVTNGKQISTSQLKFGDLIIYGSGSGFHVEMYVGPGSKTIGHGTDPIDPGTIDLFGDGNYRCFTYV
jgi:NlpC/P60 family